MKNDNELISTLISYYNLLYTFIQNSDNVDEILDETSRIFIKIESITRLDVLSDHLGTFASLEDDRAYNKLSIFESDIEYILDVLKKISDELSEGLVIDVKSRIYTELSSVIESFS